MDKCIFCKTRSNLKSKLKYITCTNCTEKDKDVCGICFDLFIYPRIVNYKFVNSKFDPTLVPTESYSTNEDEIQYWNVTNSIIQNKCSKCNATGTIEMVFTLNQKTCSFPQQTKCMRQFETIVNIQDIYKTMFVEFNTKKSPFFIQLLANPYSFKKEMESHYILNNKEEDFADYRITERLDILCESSNKENVENIDMYIVRNILLKHSIFEDSNLSFFLHEAKLLGLEMILKIFQLSSLHLSLSYKIQDLLLDYYKKELLLHSLQFHCPYCYTCYNLLYDNRLNQYITKRSYLVENLKNNKFKQTCFSCKKSMDLSIKGYGSGNVGGDLDILYEKYFAILSPEEIRSFYFHHPLYQESHDIVYDSSLAFWYIVKRLEFFYLQVWKRHTHQLYHYCCTASSSDRENIFHLIFSNPKEITFFEWIVIGFIGNFLTFEKRDDDDENEDGEEEERKIVLKQQESFKFIIQSNLTRLHVPNKKINIMDFHNFSHLSSLKAFIHSI